MLMAEAAFILKIVLVILFLVLFLGRHSTISPEAMGKAKPQPGSTGFAARSHNRNYSGYKQSTDLYELFPNQSPVY